MASNKKNSSPATKQKTTSSPKKTRAKVSTRLKWLKKISSRLAPKAGTQKKQQSTARWFSLSPVTWLACALLVAGLMTVGFLVLYYPAPPPIPPSTPITYQQIPRPQSTVQLPQQAEVPVRPQIALIMDDLGINLQIAEQALALDIPLALAILPAQRYSQQIMRLSHKAGREVLIHIPMQPISYPTNDPGPMALFTDQDQQTIRRQMEQIIADFPLAIGGNNHMGSAFTQQADKLEPVLLAMKEAGLFFIDSLTSGQSVAYARAQHLGVPSAMRDVFLDNVREVEAIQQQLQQLLNKARSNGSAIGICHTYPQTITALQQLAQQAEQAGIDVVPISQLVH